MIWLNVIIAHFLSVVFSLHTREVIIFGEEWSEMDSESQSRFCLSRVPLTDGKQDKTLQIKV